jgi:hypothetical protein
MEYNFGFDLLCEISGSHGDEYEGGYLLGYSAV